MRKFHKTDNLRFEREGIPSNILKASGLYMLKTRRYNRNQNKREVQQEIKQGLEKLSYSSITHNI